MPNNQPPAVTAKLAEAERELEQLRTELDPPVCRLQFPDGSVPGNAREAAEGWKRVADSLTAKLSEAERERNEAVAGNLETMRRQVRERMTSDADLFQDKSVADLLDCLTTAITSLPTAFQPLMAAIHQALAEAERQAEERTKQRDMLAQELRDIAMQLGIISDAALSGPEILVVAEDVKRKLRTLRDQVAKLAEAELRASELQAKLDADEFWKSLPIENAEEVRNELTDYHFVLEQVPKVYCAITGGKLSKPNYHADVVIAEYEDLLNREIAEATKEAEELSADAESAISTLRDQEAKLRERIKELEVAARCLVEGTDSGCMCSTEQGS